MKKTLAILSALAAAAAIAGEVDSGNQLGFVPVTGEAGLKAISVPVAGYSVDAAKPENIKISEILQTAGLNKDDLLYTLGSNGQYNEYKLDENGSWVASRVVTVDASGKIKETSGTPAAEATLTRGQAFWLNTQATQVNLMGQATTDQPAVTLSTGWNLIGSSSMTESMKVSSISGTVGDFLNVNGVQYQYTSSGWKNKKTKGAVTDSDVIPVGAGAMLRHQ